mgnify:CR=1 FL=1
MVHFLYLQYESHEKERVLVIVHSLSITSLIDTEDACFGLNASRPIAKGDLKWRDAVAGRTLCEQ